MNISITNKHVVHLRIRYVYYHKNDQEFQKPAIRGLLGKKMKKTHPDIVCIMKNETCAVLKIINKKDKHVPL